MCNVLQFRAVAQYSLVIKFLQCKVVLCVRLLFNEIK